MFDLDIGTMTSTSPSSTTADKSWRREIHRKIVITFAETDTSKRLLRYLDQTKSEDSEKISPVWKILKSALACSDHSFKIYSEELAEDIQRAEIDDDFHKAMLKMYAEMLDPSDNTFVQIFNGFDPERSSDRDLTRAVLLAPLARLIPFPQRGFHPARRQRASRVQFAKEAGNVVIMIVLTGVVVTGLAIKNFYRLWTQKITGRRCGKNIVDTSVTAMAGIVGYICGNTVRPNSGPFGKTALGIIFGLISSQVMEILIEAVTEYLFKISNPSSEDVTQAYNFFGVSDANTINQINSKFRKLCLKHHPDKGGTHSGILSCLKQHTDKGGTHSGILSVYHHFRIIKLTRDFRILT